MASLTLSSMPKQPKRTSSSASSAASSASSSSFTSSAVSSSITRTPPGSLIAQSVETNINIAKHAVSDIKRVELSELRLLKTEPKGVFDIISAVLSLLNHEPNKLDWNETRKVVTDVKFSEKLKVYDPDTITEQDHLNCKEALDNKEIPTLSIACKMQIWVQRMCAANLREATTEIDPQKPLGLKLTRSGVVHYVSVRGQFYEAGIQKGDKVLGLGTIRISTSKEFAAALNLYKAAGGKVAVIFTESKRKVAPTNDVPSLKVNANANEPTSNAPREFGSFRAKGTKIP